MEMFHIQETSDAIDARQRGRDIARELGFSLIDQTVITYTISELALKLVSLSEKGHMTIRAIGVNKGEVKSGIEVRLFDHFRGPNRIDPRWIEKIVDDMEVMTDSIRGTMITFRKWLISPLRIDSPICAAGEE
ncbi:hypothetical protein Back11_61840 [Paenibacillus baekrokdamisoli]|uniref:Uncharacterized protein n=2 Tax=Paenibacillus baekrokdamisoli TaxID=1712516 RepID=A0A3G9JP52_9BACL|nr:serine/threonine-protein kinase RsbT [Paenibacillus baekrokdamisoli]BBH24839.1 hypothetical protein Back11_61840 [Paenibacillus baekrokdamisoli]